jgi:hypothetical protein
MGFKPFHGEFADTIGMNRLFMAQGLKEGVEAVDSVYNAGQSWWNQDYQGFSHLGQGVSQVFSGASNFGISTAMGFGALANRSSYGIGGSAGREAGSFLGIKYGARAPSAGWGGRTVVDGAGFIEKGSARNAGFWVKDKGGTLRHNLNTSEFGPIQPRVLQGEAAEIMTSKLKPTKLFSKENPINLMAGGAKTELTTAQLLSMSAAREANWMVRAVRGMGTMRGVGVLIGAQVLGGMAVNKITSIAGGLMDEAHLAHQQNKYAHYDSRQFNNKAMQNWGMNIGGAMGSFEMNNMSIARAYHSRG